MDTTMTMMEIWQGGSADEVGALASDVDMAARRLNPFLSGHSVPVDATPANVERLARAAAILRDVREMLDDVGDLCGLADRPAERTT